MTATATSKSRCERAAIMIVDDHPIVRRGLRELIEQEPDLRVSCEADSAEEALRRIEGDPPNLVIVDLSLEGTNGIDLIEQIRCRWPNIKTLVSSIHDEQVFAGRVLRAGGMGYVCKRESTETLIEAVRQVLRGEIYLSSRMASRLLHRAASGEPLDSNPVDVLSNRELEVFEMIGQGLTIHQIARKLGLSAKTVETHRKNIKTKLSLQNSVQLNRCAYQWTQENH